MANFVSYSDAQSLMTEIGNKFKNLTGALKYRGSVTYANLPSTLTKALVGNVYNVTNEFTIDSRFIEYDPLDPKSYPAGTDVAIADLSYEEYQAVTPAGTENPSEEGWYEEDSQNPGEYILTEDTEIVSGKTYYALVTVAVYKFDVGMGFINVQAIKDEIEAIISDSFDVTAAYAIDDVVIYNNKLYKFKAAHTANDPWDATEVDEVTVVELIEAAEPDSLTPAQINALLDLLD